MPPKAPTETPANLPSTRIRARIIAPVTPSPRPSMSIGGFGLRLDRGWSHPPAACSGGDPVSGEFWVACNARSSTRDRRTCARIDLQDTSVPGRSQDLVAVRESTAQALRLPFGVVSRPVTHPRTHLIQGALLIPIIEIWNVIWLGGFLVLDGFFLEVESRPHFIE